jgi:hypothetical protein
MQVREQEHDEEFAEIAISMASGTAFGTVLDDIAYRKSGKNSPKRSRFESLRDLSGVCSVHKRPEHVSLSCDLPRRAGWPVGLDPWQELLLARGPGFVSRIGQKHECCIRPQSGSAARETWRRPERGLRTLETEAAGAKRIGNRAT